MSTRYSQFTISFILVCCVLAVAMVQPAAGKSAYLAANHHTRQFDAWNIGSDGLVSYQATYNLMHSTDPAGIGIDAITDNDQPIMFISSEFSHGVEIVNPVTLEYIGVSSGPSNLAGVDVDDMDDIVYTLRRRSNDLYIYQWDPVAKSLIQQAVIDLPGMSYGFGIALDDSRDILWVTDYPNSMVRAYDVNVSSWNDIVEVPALSFSVSHTPVDVTVDSYRNLVYTVAGYYYSSLLSKYDVAAGVETTVGLPDGVGGIGIAVEEIKGYVYITRGTSSVGDDVQVWDCSTSPFTLLQDTPRIGNPAGIAIANVSYNPLNLAKNDNVVGYGVYIGQTFTYEITCGNDSNSVDATNVMIRDDLPVELDFVSETVDGTPGTGIYDPVVHTVTWDIGTIPAFHPGPFIELVVRVNQNASPDTTIYNYCNIWSDQSDTTTVIGDDPDDTTGNPGTPILPAIPVAFDIKPTSCPNPLNIKGGDNRFAKIVPQDGFTRAAVLPAAILGTEDFDVRLIDPTTVELAGVPVKRWSYEDVTTPVPDDAEECECTTLGSDGFQDLTLKFDKTMVRKMVGDVEVGDVIPLTITGMLMDGTPIIGVDCVVMVGNRVVDPEHPFSLGNRPNPFNPATEISFSLPVSSQVRLDIFNVLGQKIKTLVAGYLPAGDHTVTWDGNSDRGNKAASGVYFYRIEAGDFGETKKMLLLK